MGVSALCRTMREGRDELHVTILSVDISFGFNVRDVSRCKKWCSRACLIDHVSLASAHNVITGQQDNVCVQQSDNGRTKQPVTQSVNSSLYSTGACRTVGSNRQEGQESEHPSFITRAILHSTRSILRGVIIEATNNSSEYAWLKKWSDVAPAWQIPMNLRDATHQLSPVATRPINLFPT
ncbi:hypothetical protein OBBRIDRAFT_88556 [Obba rivulosa]|uniref:Uncharacterized protein n=1 Tax=Obba rivulosa TaxID=1052685 RepID=A0A8E2AUQ6_9APHY|nr:hypothetical protein OBBRIDRAFT_88556 [Obba rivulosa]